MAKKPHGELTEKNARLLSPDLESRGYDMLSDHSASNDRVGRIVSWYGPDSDYKSEARLSCLDMAVVSQSSRRALALVEIEETNDAPKTLVADILCTLLGDHITFKGKCKLGVGKWTTLIVLAKGRASHREPIAFLKRQVRSLQHGMSTRNASIGRVILGTFASETDLTRKLKEEIDEAIREGNAVR